MTPVHRVIKNTGILYARMAITVLLSLYTTRIVLGALGAEDFGIFSVVGGTIAMLTFLNASMTAATQRFMSFAQGQGDENRQHQIFNVSTVLHVVIAMLVLGLLEGVGFLLFDGVLKIEPARLHAAWLVYQFAAISTFFTILAVPYDAVINAHEHMLLFAVLGVIEAVLKLAIAFVIVDAAADKLELYGLLTAALSVVLLLIRISYCHNKYRECELALRRHFSRPLFKEMAAFAGWSLLGHSTGMVSFYGQGLVLNVFFGATVNAALGVTNQVSGQLGAFATTMMRALNPLLAKSEGAGERQLMLKATAMGAKFGFFLLMLFYVPVMLEMPYLFDLWLKEVPPYTIIFCSILLIRNLVEQLFIPITTSIAAVGNIKRYQIVSSAITFFPLPATYLMFHFGYEPYFMYVVFLIYSVALFSVVLFYARKYCGLDVLVYLKDVVCRCVVAFLIGLSICSLPRIYLEDAHSRSLTVLGLWALSFLPVIWLSGLNREERLSVSLLVKTAIRQKIKQLQ